MAKSNNSSRKSALSKAATIGLDLDKYGVHVVALDADGQVVTRRRYTKTKPAGVRAGLEPCRIGREACCGAHHHGRVLLGQRHDVKLIPPEYVKPFGQRDKNDSCDAEACAEACLRPTMRCVQQVRSAAQLINQARAFLLERRIAIPQGNTACQRLTAIPGVGAQTATTGGRSRRTGTSRPGWG